MGSADHPSEIPAPYEPVSLEAKWRARWAELGTNVADIPNAARPYYALMMFPYPSAEGLHVGNMFAFTGNDIFARFQRMQGLSVFQPLGYDAFGIHSENYALKVGVHPAEMIPRNIANFRRQLERGGLMVDWTRSLSTTDPEYYRWTQWVFLQLYKQGLVHKKAAAVNWCPTDKTVLANEQVVAGACERCGSVVEQRFLEQWFFAISRYSERLLANLDSLDWSETTKTAQRNWIGKSEGAEIWFDGIKVFTTRPDTIFGATYVVLAPEHPLVDAHTTEEQRAAVDEYRERASRRDLVSRKTSKDKTGVSTGSTVTNPATGEQIPVWVSDYVLMEYGSGAIMAVPAHDERDLEFAHGFELPVKKVVHEDDTLIESGEFTGLTVHDAKRAIVGSLAAKDKAAAVTNYRLHDWCISRQRYWGPPIPIIYCDDCGVVPVPEKDLPVLLPMIEDFKPDDSGISPLARHDEWYRVPCPTCAKMARRETDVSDTFLDSAWYFLRYPNVGNDSVAFDPDVTKKWLPVDSYIGGNEHAVLHLLYSRFVTMVLHDAGLIEFDEPFTKFRAHGLIIREGAKMSKSKGNVVNPDEYIEAWGADTFRTYLMFLGPFEEGGDFRDKGISGVRRFLDRLWASVRDSSLDAIPDAEVDRKLHATIRKVGDDIPRLSYNTAIAAMMEYMNVLRKNDRVPRRAEVESLVQLVAPFAPHLAEELWEQLGHSGTIFDSAWPTFDPALLATDDVDIVVQVNGKMRGRLRVTRDADESIAHALAMADTSIAKFVSGTPRKIIFVPGRLLNIVV
ncbi:MAG: leucine--tRNA ligase [Gemmatimonadaceae bacterium]